MKNEDNNSSNIKSEPYYPLQLEQLTEKLFQNDLKEAQDTVLELFHKNPNSEFYLYTMLCVITSVIHILSEIENIDTAQFIREIDIKKRLNNCLSKDDYLKEALAVTEYAYIYIHSANSIKISNIKLIEQICCFIDKNYNLFDLSVNYIADKFNLNSVTVSQLFKKVKLQSLHDYINYCRIEHAKDIMEKNYTNLNELAFKIGYNNTKTLTRVFKKYIGMTPGQYKNKLNKNREEVK